MLRRSCLIRTTAACLINFRNGCEEGSRRSARCFLKGFVARDLGFGFRLSGARAVLPLLLRDMFHRQWRRRQGMGHKRGGAQRDDGDQDPIRRVESSAFVVSSISSAWSLSRTVARLGKCGKAAPSSALNSFGLRALRSPLCDRLRAQSHFLLCGQACEFPLRDLDCVLGAGRLDASDRQRLSCDQKYPKCLF
jgi:hypothetical protein